MPRSIETIMASHREANDRRAKGQPIWDRKIAIKHILARDKDNTSNEYVALVANEIGAVLRKKVPARFLDTSVDDYDDRIREVIEGMEDLRAESYKNDPSFSPLQDLNNMLDDLYDWADKHRVWIE